MRISRTAVLLSALLAGACGLTEPSGPLGEAKAQLAQARRQWVAQGLADYTFVFSRSCFCVFEYREPVTITVRGGHIVSVVTVANGSPRDSSTYQTIEGLFDDIQQAIDEEAATIRADYDPSRGHPTSVYIDIDERIADEEISFEARGLAPLR